MVRTISVNVAGCELGLSFQLIPGITWCSWELITEMFIGIAFVCQELSSNVKIESFCYGRSVISYFSIVQDVNTTHN